MPESDTTEVATGGAFRDNRPSTGDLVDRYLAQRLRSRLFGEAPEVQLGRLTVDGVLGQGAMGAVVSAFDPTLDRHVAIKSVRPERGEQNDKLLAEAKLLATLDHRSVVEIYDVITEDGTVHLVMERIDGVTMREWMAEGHRLDEALALFGQLADGLAAAHDRGIVHSDIKPENILVDGERAVLIDFGLAFRSGDRARHGGTMAYLAPEREDGGPGSSAADQYAFFVTMREAIGESATKRVERVIERGTAANASARFRSMRDAAVALAPKRSRAALWTALAAAAIATGVAVTLAVNKDDPDPCANASQPIADAWTDRAREGVVSAVGKAAASRLDGYYTQLAEARQQSCESTRVRGEQSDSFLDRSTRCTDDRLRGVNALVELFSSHPPERVVSTAEQLVTKLDDVGECSDADALAQRVPLPSDPAVRRSIAAIQEDFESAKNLERRGDFKQALVDLEAIVTRARGVGYSPLEAEALLLRGSVQETLGELDDADATFRAASTAAAKAKDDRRLAETWIRLLELLAKRGKHDQALEIETVARASVERVPQAKAIAARLYNALGGIYLARTNYDAAYAAYDRALTLQREIGSEGNRALGPAIANRALVKWHRGDLASAFVDQKEALGIMIRELGPDHAHVAYAHQNLADLAQRLGPEEKKIAPHHFREALRIWSASLGPEHPNLAYPLEQLADLERRSGEIDSAREKISRVLSLRTKAYGADHALVLQAKIVAIEIEAGSGTPAGLKAAAEKAADARAHLEQLGDGGRRYATYLSRAELMVAEARGDWRSATKIHQRIIEETTAEFGAGPQLAKAHVSFAVFLVNRGSREAARQLAIADKLYDEKGGPVSARIDTKRKRAKLAASSNDIARARQHLLAAIALAKEVGSPELATLEASLLELD